LRLDAEEARKLIAVSAETSRRPRTMSEVRLGGTSMARASATPVTMFFQTASPHISRNIGASGPRISESSFARTTYLVRGGFPDADAV
jgi:hypothetical protein